MRASDVGLRRQSSACGRCRRGRHQHRGRNRRRPICSAPRSKRATRRSKAGVDLWVNARIDVYLRNLAEGEAAYDETVEARAALSRRRREFDLRPDGGGRERSGALREGDRRAASTCWRGRACPTAARLKELGVRRLSAGSGVGKSCHSITLYAMAKDFLGDGASEPLDRAPLAQCPADCNGHDAPRLAASRKRAYDRADREFKAAWAWDGHILGYSAPLRSGLQRWACSWAALRVLAGRAPTRCGCALRGRCSRFPSW